MSTSSCLEKLNLDLIMLNHFSFAISQQSSTLIYASLTWFHVDRLHLPSSILGWRFFESLFTHRLSSLLSCLFSYLCLLIFCSFIWSTHPRSHWYFYILVSSFEVNADFIPCCTFSVFSILSFSMSCSFFSEKIRLTPVLVC